MDKKVLIGLGVLLVSGLVFATGGLTTVRDFLATGNAQVNGDLVVDNDILGNNNLSIANSIQAGGTISASDYLGETVIENAFGSDSCNDTCGDWTSTSYQCVEAIQGNTQVSCSTPATSGRIRCLCKN